MKIGLALSGGGARGIYHIGVLRAFEEKGIKLEIISGTSVGALIGVLYASGLSAHSIFKIASDTKWFKFFKPGLPSAGLIGMEYIEEVLRTYLKVRDFESLDIPCYVTACNLSKGKLEIFNSGDVVKPVLASCSVPMLFKPVVMGTDLYLDGGILMNLPSAIIRNKCSVLVGVSLMPIVAIPGTELNSSIKVLTRVLELNINNNTRFDMQQCDVLIESSAISGFSRYVLRDYDVLYKMGYQEAVTVVENNPIFKGI